jgi:hypothetical protein
MEDDLGVVMALCSSIIRSDTPTAIPSFIRTSREPV